MQRSSKLLLIFFAFLIGIIALFFTFTLYNNLSYLKSSPHFAIGTAKEFSNYPPANPIKILSYNIHYGMGLNAKRIDQVDEKGFIKRLDQIAFVLEQADADIVLLQEVDFFSTRSHKINQAKYLANKAGYNFYATAPHWRRKLFPDINGRHGILDHGLCILSRYPLFDHEAHKFALSDEYPFFLKWLYNPHGAQKVKVKIAESIFTLINLHLDPWSYVLREKQMKKVLLWTRSVKEPIILGGDFNIEPSEAPFQSISHLKDRPWFVKIDIEKLKGEQTLVKLKQEGFTPSISSVEYLKNPKEFYTYPADDPKVKLDYLFAGPKIKILEGNVFHNANQASDHLPVYALMEY